MNYNLIPPNAMRDETFFIELGQRVAQHRQRAGLSQAQLAERLNLKQQALATYESATRRLPSSLLVPLCSILEVSLDELLGVEPERRKPGRIPKIQEQFEAISQLPKSDQKFFSSMIDRFLTESEAKVS